MTTDTNNNDADMTAPAKRSWKKPLIIGAVALAALAGVGAAAFADGGPDDFGPHMGMRGRLMRGFMEYRINQILTDVGANDAQKAKLEALIKTTMDEVRPDRNEMRHMHDEALDLLTAPTIDRTAIEALRVKHVAEVDARSKTIAKAIGDAAEVLTPEQRKKLVDELDDMGPAGPGKW